MFRSRRFVVGAALASMVAASTAYAHGELTVVSWGGSYARSQMLAYIKPFREQSGEWVSMETYNGGLDEIRAQVGVGGERRDKGRDA